MFEFWRKWMLVVTAGQILLGLAFGLVGTTGLFAVLNDAINRNIFGEAVLSAEQATYQQFIYGVFGGTTAAWGVMALFLVLFAFRSRQRWVWMAFVDAALIWFLLDAGISLWLGVYPNVVFASLLLAGFVPPLAATWRRFDQPATSAGLSGAGLPRSA